MERCAKGFETKLAANVVDFKCGDGCLFRLWPLAAAHGRATVTSPSVILCLPDPFRCGFAVKHGRQRGNEVDDHRGGFVVLMLGVYNMAYVLGHYTFSKYFYFLFFDESCNAC